MRDNIEALLLKQHIHFDSLLPAEKLLLITDGTVTELLEAMLNERLHLGYKHQDAYTDAQTQIKRVVVLAGKQTNIPWLYAESLLFTDVLPSDIALQLQQENLPIGTIFQQLKSDTHREIVDCGYMQHIPAAEKLFIDDGYEFLYRRYRIVSQDKTLMQISEWFPFHRINVRMHDQFNFRR